MWCSLYVCYAAVIVWCAVIGSAASDADVLPEAHPEPEVSSTAGDALYWTALAACGSALLLAATNHMCQEVAVIPFLWILPLALYLATFALCFDQPGSYRPLSFGLLAMVAVPLDCWLLTLAHPSPYWQELGADALALVACCMICHGELARSRPQP